MLPALAWVTKPLWRCIQLPVLVTGSRMGRVSAGLPSALPGAAAGAAPAAPGAPGWAA